MRVGYRLGILRDAAVTPQGLTVDRFSSMSSAQRDDLLATSWAEGGLKGLLRRETIPSPLQPRKGTYRFLVTDAARKFLKELKDNPDALPQIPRGNPGFISAQARLWSLRRSQKKHHANKVKDLNRKKYEEAMANPAYSVSDYDVAPSVDVNPNSPDFKYLPPLERIRILRQQSKKS